MRTLAYQMDTQVIERHLKCMLRFGVGKPVLDGFTNSDMSGDVDSSRSTSSYLMTYAGDQCHGNQDRRSLWPCRQQKQNIWQR